MERTGSKTCTSCGLSVPLEGYYTAGANRMEAKCKKCSNKSHYACEKARRKALRQSVTQSLTDEEKELRRRSYNYQKLVKSGYKPEWIAAVQASMQKAASDHRDSYQTMNPWEKLCSAIAMGAHKRSKQPIVNTKRRYHPNTLMDMVLVQQEQARTSFHQCGKMMGKWDTKMATTATNWRRKT